NDAFTMAQLTRALRLNQGSAHAVLTAMTEQAFLIRHPEHRTFRLGPALVNAGEAAALANPIIAIARAELQSLTDRLQLPALASMRAGSELRVVVRVGPQVAVGPSRRVGQRYPLVPPLGAALVAWSPPEDQEEWIDSRPADLDGTALRRLLDEVRSRGYDLGAGVAARRELGRAVKHLANEPLDERAKATVRASASRVPAAAPDDVAVVTAPVLNAAGCAVLECSVHGFASPPTADTLTRVTTALRDACTVIARRVAAHGNVHIDSQRSQEVG
ncbi:MAG TPA: hypothetical protein PKV27_03570, partial [Ilumatobacteraceae bacterium]|nr:hypothetical protein [Ilumatobacteraceae bacterium]